MRCFSLLLIITLGTAGCSDNWTCKDDEAVSSFDGKCTRRKSASQSSGVDGGRSPGAREAGIAKDGGFEAWVSAHGTSCTSDADCSPLASYCSTQLHEKCPTTGCCVSKGCAESDPSTCPPKWHCLYIAYGIDQTFCVPD